MEKELFFNDYTSAPQTTWSQSQLGSFICNQNWEISMDQSDPFGSALSSIVSSPKASSAEIGGGDFMIRELIGRLGSICNSGEISPHSNIGGSTNTSCYNTPLNSPPKLNLSMADPQVRANFQFSGHHVPSHPTISPFSADPGSSFHPPKSIFEKFNWFATSSTAENAELGGSMEGSTLTEQNPGGKLSVRIKGENNSRKRKSIPKGEPKESKRNRQNDASEVQAKPSGDIKEEEDGNQNQTKPPEPPKDYIHVRARRGQATDSHSLAERVRREKIRQRMNFLQDLVPGCKKVTGKAVMLDELINYVQSLQRQVEFLSMKLATTNRRMDATMEGLLPPFSSGYQALQLQTINGGVSSNLDGGYGKSSHQVAESWADDLQSVVQIGYDPNQQKRCHGPMAETQMKAAP